MINDTGFHARPASIFVQVANRFRSDIHVKANGRVADAKSILMLMGLGISKGTEIMIVAQGDDEDNAVNILVRLVESGF